MAFLLGTSGPHKGRSVSSEPPLEISFSQDVPVLHSSLDEALALLDNGSEAFNDQLSVIRSLAEGLAPSDRLFRESSAYYRPPPVLA